MPLLESPKSIIHAGIYWLTENATRCMVWYGNSLFDITKKYIVIAKYLIKYMIYVWRLHKEYTGCSLPCSHQGKC